MQSRLTMSSLWINRMSNVAINDMIQTKKPNVKYFSRDHAMVITVVTKMGKTRNIAEYITLVPLETAYWESLKIRTNLRKKIMHNATDCVVNATI